MPLRGNESVGFTQVCSAEVVVRRTLVLAADAAAVGETLEVWGMPRLSFWMLQTVGVLGATAIAQFGVTTVAGGLIPILEWLPLNAGGVIPPGGLTPLLWNFNFPARYIRLQITRPAGQATTVQYVIGASQ
jgi:hypothetical protein